MSKKIDLRFTDAQEAITEIARALNETPFTDRALAVLITDMGKGVSMSQVLTVIRRARELEKHVLKVKKK